MKTHRLGLDRKGLTRELQTRSKARHAVAVDLNIARSMFLYLSAHDAMETTAKPISNRVSCGLTTSKLNSTLAGDGEEG